MTSGCDTFRESWWSTPTGRSCAHRWILWLPRMSPSAGDYRAVRRFELSMAHLIEAVTETTWSPSERIRAAVSAEREGAGVPCGVMDQTIVEQGQQGCVLLLDCAEELISSIIPCDDPQIAWLVIHSGVSHDLADGAYAQRRAECEMICEALQVGSLRDVTPEMITTLTPDLPAPSPASPPAASPIQSPAYHRYSHRPPHRYHLLYKSRLTRCCSGVRGTS